MSIETSIIYTTSDDKQFDDRQEAETHEQWLADEPEAREADRQRGWIGRRRYHGFEQPLNEAERKRDAAFEESAAIVDAFNHVNMSIVNGERTPLKDGDRAWFTLLAVTLATLIPFVEGKDGDRVGFMMGDTSNGFNINITSPEFLACCRSMWVGADVYRAFGRYLNFRWDTIREAWVENGSGLAFIGADGQVAYMLETAMSKGDGIRFDPMEGREDTVRLFRLLLETAKCADIPVRFTGGSGSFQQDE